MTEYADDDQAWFWTEEWQAGEREASEQIAAGLTTFCGSTEEFLAALDKMCRPGTMGS